MSTDKITSPPSQTQSKLENSTNLTPSLSDTSQSELYSDQTQFNHSVSSAIESLGTMILLAITIKVTLLAIPYILPLMFFEYL